MLTGFEVTEPDGTIRFVPGEQFRLFNHASAALARSADGDVFAILGNGAENTETSIFRTVDM